MPPDKGGMDRISGVVALIVTAALAFSMGDGSSAETHPEAGPVSQQAQLTEDQQAFVDFAVGRFAAQGMELPDVEFVFHADLSPCQGHKGMYHPGTGVLEMCSMDENTMLHELAHAWANENLTDSQKQDFVASRNLDSWNDHETAWEDRGTEHVAETIAWALASDPHHVKWVETNADGSSETTHRILTIGIDVEALLVNFDELTGMEPIFRDPSEWTPADNSNSASPEQARPGR